jgi:uncharacterized protein (TIGR00251 family)
VELSIQETKEGVLFKAVVQPRSSKNMIFGVEDGALKIKLTAPPVKGAANKLCVKFLTSMLKVPSSDIEIVSGQRRRNKKILVHSVTRKYLESKLFLSKAD